MKIQNKIVVIQGDAIQTINSKTDTTLLLALEAQRRGYKIFYYETKDLTFSNGKIYALAKEVNFNVEKQQIIDIPGLNYNKDRKKFTLKRLDKQSSINTRLAPKTIKHKNKKKNKSRGKKTQKTKIDIHLKE